MHILFLSNELPGPLSGGGIGAYVQTMSQGLAARGHRVTIITRRLRSEAALEELDYARIIRVSIGNVHWYLSKLPGIASTYLALPLRELEWSLAFRPAVKRLLGRETVDVVETIGLGDYWMSFDKRLPPVVFRIHGLAYEFVRHTTGRVPWGARLNLHMQIRVALGASAITAPSEASLNEFRSHLCTKIPVMCVIPNPIAPWVLELASSDEISAPGLSTEESVVLYTGRIEYRKGSIPLLHSVPLVVKAFPNVCYVMAGRRHNSIDDHTLNRVLDKDNTRAHVQLLGHVPWRQLTDWYRRAAIFVMPSYYEPFGISVLEAMAFGLPVVATTAGGLPEVVEDGVTGILVPPGDPQALAKAIICLLRDPDLRRRMGQAGRARVLAEFTVERVVEQTLAVYQEVVGR